MTATRRPVPLRNLDDLLAEVDHLEAAQAAGAVRALGRWSAAQAVWHLARFLAFSIDGFPFRYPWYWRRASRALGWLSWRALLAAAFRPGFCNPPAAAGVEPPPSLQWPEAAAYFREQARRLAGGARMTRRSPTGELPTHDQWLEAHLRHAELHLGFLCFERPPAAAALVPEGEGP